MAGKVIGCLIGLMKCPERDVKRCLCFRKKVSLVFTDVDGCKRNSDTLNNKVAV